MLRILFLVRSLDVGGAERQLVELVKNIDHDRFDIHVVTFYDGGALRPLLENLPRVNVSSLGKSHRWDVISFFWKLYKLVKSYRPQVIQSFLDVPNSFNVLVGRLTGAKVVLGVSASFIDFSRYDWTHLLVYKTSAFLSRFANQVIANSYAGGKYNIEHGYSTQNITVIPNGIDTYTFQPNKDAGERLRAKWKIDKSEKVIGLIGRLDPMKDHPNFLHAAALVSQRFPSARFVCVGRGPKEYQSEMQNLASSLLPQDKVLWISDCEDRDIPAAYNAFDIFVSSSYGEGLPVVLGEGMASGVPCVVTNVGDSAIAVDDTGFAVPPQNSKELADAICRMLEMAEQERQYLGQKARQRVLDHFSIEKMASSYETVYENLTKQ
jgi:glycosyltransferase involved in cell wall biosynthesis